MKKPNPPIPGHELILEGSMKYRVDLDGTVRWTGGCRCGAQPDNTPPPNPDTKINKAGVKKWHRTHKAALRGGL